MLTNSLKYMIDSVECSWGTKCIHFHDCLVTQRSKRNEDGNLIGKFLPELHLEISGAFFVQCNDCLLYTILKPLGIAVYRDRNWETKRETQPTIEAKED